MERGRWSMARRSVADRAGGWIVADAAWPGGASGAWLNELAGGVWPMQRGQMERGQQSMAGGSWRVVCVAGAEYSAWSMSEMERGRAGAWQGWLTWNHTDTGQTMAESVVGVFSKSYSSLLH